MKKLALLSLLFLSSCASLPNFLELADLNPSTHYQHFETEHFEFTYQDGYLNFAKEAAKHIEHAHTIISPVLQWQPRNKIHVLIADNNDSANGFAMPSFRTGIVLIATPPDQWMSTSYSENWIKLLVFHEYTHILNIDPTTDWMEALRVIFGDGIRPNGLWPTWTLEGLAVYFETKTSVLGRGRSPYYDAIVRSYFSENRLGQQNNGIHYGSLSGDWPYFPAGETAYLFGYRLWNQFAKDAKDDQKMGDYSIHSSHRFPWFMDGNLENVTGKTWGDYWQTFAQESSTRYQEQITRIKAIGETPYTKITHSNFSAIGGTISPNGEWIAYTETRLDERQGLTLHHLPTGKEHKIKDKVLGVSMSFTPDSKKLIFSSLGRDTTFTQFSDLWTYDLDERSFTQLSDGLRAKDPQLSPDGKKLTFITVDHATQILKTAEFISGKDPRIENIQTVYQPKEFSMLGTPHWLNDSEIVFSQQELNQAESKIIQMSITSPTSSKVVIQNGKMNRFPFACNQKLYYVSDATGIDNIYTDSKAVTNVVTATQFPFCSAQGDLYGSLLTSNGFEIVKFTSATSPTETHETIAKADAPESLTEALQSPEIKMSEPEEYNPWRTLAPRQWAPYLTFDSVSGTTMGGAVLGFDSTGKHQYAGSLAYNFKSTTVDQGFQYTYYGFRPSITVSEESFTSDIATDFKQSRFKRTHELTLRLSHLIRWTWSSLRISPYALMDWNSIQDISTKQRVISADLEYNHPYIPVAGLGVTFSDAIQSKLGFMPEGGSRVTGVTQSRIYDQEFTLWRFLAEYSRYVGLGSHHVLNPKLRYLGSSHPYGPDRSYALLKGKDTFNPFDDGTGYNLNQLQIRGYPNMTFKTKSSVQGGLDYHFPVDTFFTGADSIFFQQAHGFVFADATYIPSTRFRNLFLPAFGLGLTADTTLLWHLPVSVSLQMQCGTRKDFGGDQTFFLTFGGSIL